MKIENIKKSIRSLKLALFVIGGGPVGTCTWIINRSLRKIIQNYTSFGKIKYPIQIILQYYWLYY